MKDLEDELNRDNMMRMNRRSWIINEGIVLGYECPFFRNG